MTTTSARARIATLDHPDLQLVEPFDTDVMVDGETIGLWHASPEVIGIGPDLPAATRAFGVAIVELSLALEGEGDHAGALLGGHWEELQRHVVPRPATCPA